MLTDPISDMLTRFRNASAARKSEAALPFSRTKYDIAKIFEREGYVGKVEKNEKSRTITVALKYANGEPAIRYIARISRPGKRVYASYHELPRVLNDIGIAIISTPQGVMTNKDARKRHLGGEVICEIY